MALLLALTVAAPNVVWADTHPYVKQKLKNIFIYRFSPQSPVSSIRL